MEKLLAGIIQEQVKELTWDWLKDKAEAIKADNTAKQLNLSFTVLPRKTGKHILSISQEQEEAIRKKQPGFSISGWNIDRLCRVWLLMQIDSTDKTVYTHKIEQLFLTAEMNEQVALYSALPLLDWPETWKFRCTEGIRSNIALVLEAIMYENPYAEQWLDEREWNQMILKAFFTDKNVDRIYGIDRRANQTLADILIDYAHERWQAQRSVNPQLWRLVGKFINQKTFADLQKLYREGNPIEKKAAILACSQSDFAPAKQLATDATRSTQIMENLSWTGLLKETLQTSHN